MTVVLGDPDRAAIGKKTRKLVGDAGIGPGQCVVETDKGMVEYFIEEHLKQVSEALMGAKVDG